MMETMITTTTSDVLIREITVLSQDCDLSDSHVREYVRGMIELAAVSLFDGKGDLHSSVQEVLGHLPSELAVVFD